MKKPPTEGEGWTSFFLFLCAKTIASIVKMMAPKYAARAGGALWPARAMYRATSNSKAAVGH